MGSPSNVNKYTTSALLGAAFLMATSAIGPGFITQTTVFTQQLTTSFGFVILCSIAIDIIVQLNIWRIVSASGMRAQDLANRYFRGTGYVLAVLIVVGGLAFNIGNIAGAGLGVNAMMDLDLSIGVIISAVIAVIIFWYPNAGKAMDWFTKILGTLMILVMVYIVSAANPPLASALHHTFVPEKIDTASILVLVGGTVGGYISFAGVHRLLDEGVSGAGELKTVTRSATRGILIVSAMRILLFLAALGIVSSGVVLRADNPAASVFENAAGQIGFRIFGLVLWCAAITSVVGSAFTSVSFLRTFHPLLDQHRRSITTIFILISTIIFLMVGRPVRILVIVGALNAFVLPFALIVLLLIARRMKKNSHFDHPLWLEAGGWITAVALLALSVKTILYDLASLWH